MGDPVSQSENRDSPTVLLRRLHRWRMASFGLIILVAGLTIGAAATFLVLHRKGPEPVVPPERAHAIMLERIVPRLRLAPQQAEQVRPILRKHMDRLEEIREQGRQQIVKELQAMDTEMSSVLRADQQQLWRNLLRELPGPFPRGPGGRYGPGPRSPFGPRGGGQGRLRRGAEGSSPSLEPNAPQHN
ncbi:MAG: hypothetical protein JXR77_06525 [Lentisphaeria bacterium]|nr:hypothetical protein [Lentisphaeria bacterium]